LLAHLFSDRGRIVSGGMPEAAEGQRPICERVNTSFTVRVRRQQLCKKYPTRPPGGERSKNDELASAAAQPEVGYLPVAVFVRRPMAPCFEVFV
jgi:hypothetical protein